MEMHKLDFKIEKPDQIEEYPKFVVQLDGLNEPQSFVVLPLEISAQKDGLYPILNCGCGEWGCGGYYVKVKNTPDQVIWEKIQNYIDQTEPIHPLHIKAPIVFERTQYEDLISRLLKTKDKYLYEKSVYQEDLDQYQKSGMESLYNLK